MSVSATSQRVIDLYRRTVREIPRIIAIFDLDLTEKEVRTDVRGLFQKHAKETNPRTIDHLLIKGELDLEESVNIWKQKSHILRLLGRDEGAREPIKKYSGESEFLRKFYAGHNL